MAASTVKPSSVSYFYGRITRDEAEEVLRDRGCTSGLFLLRESINPLGNYAISICHDNKVHHYVIEKQTDGSYMIPSGKRFQGPIELISHHERVRDGIVTLLSEPCNRLPNQKPVAFRGMTYEDFERELLRKADSIRGVNKERALGSQREHLVIMVARDLHTKQPWYHGLIDRNKSEKRLKESGHKDGKFLVRLREDKQTFALSLSYQNNTRPYLIDRTPDDKFGIQDGPKFDNIMMLVDHYHNKQDGLLCKLSEPCPSPGFDPNQLDRYKSCNLGNLEYLKIGSVRNGSIHRTSSQSKPILGAAGDVPPEVPTSRPRPLNRNTSRKLPPTPVEAHNRIKGDIEEVSQTPGFSSRRIELDRLGYNPESLEGIYGSLPRTEADLDLDRKQIDLQETLGAGQFGSVCKGMCTLKSGRQIPVAIKTLKKEDMSVTQEPELIKEAKIMMPLSHKNIVRMIGLCKAECIMLVLELAPLGQLNTYLQHHQELPQYTIVELLWQVAQGMEYLESKKFVHRDLAARNVLLVSEHFAKISDFGMSKAVGRGNNYYEAREAGKWPLKWYAPECVYYWKFDSKSDVWSYGVTMWEATSYGDRPYKKMKGQELLTFLVEQEKRLPCPEFCDDEVYNVMLTCWEYDKHKRPSFQDLACTMCIIYNRMISR